jgi:hypothetical protein
MELEEGKVQAFLCKCLLARLEEIDDKLLQILRKAKCEISTAEVGP